MPRKKSKAVPEGNGPVPQDISGLLGGITLGELRRIKSGVKDKGLDDTMDKIQKTRRK